MPSLPTDLASLLRAIIAETELSKTQFAKTLGITKSTLSHLLSGHAGYSLNPLACLKLASAFGTPPSRVLRAAGWRDLADHIEGLYGPAAERRAQFIAGRRVTPLDAHYLAHIRALSPAALKALDVLLLWRRELDARARRPKPKLVAARKG